MTAVVLHISDIHVRSAEDPILKRAPDIARATYAALPNASAVLVVVSGDIAFSGEREQYEAALAFFETLREEIQREKPVPVYFIPCPGNHDCDFSKDDSTRKYVLAAVQGRGATGVDQSVIDTCVRVQSEYFAFVTCPGFSST